MSRCLLPAHVCFAKIKKDILSLSSGRFICCFFAFFSWCILHWHTAGWRFACCYPFVPTYETECFPMRNTLFGRLEHFVSPVRTFCFIACEHFVFLRWNKVFICGGTKCFYMVKQNVLVYWNKLFLYVGTKCFCALEQTVHCCELMRYLVISMKRACVSATVLCTGKRRRNSFSPQVTQDYYGLYLLVINDLI